ncbi:MAG: hypothetical protein JHD16_16020 [Solirubrobacteraceae bacterium]|nr:hypothetical protein [Solirubrobacteraceae bacterium]
MAHSRPLLAAALIASSSLTMAAPAQAGPTTTKAKVVADAWTATIKKQLDPKTSVIGRDLRTTAQNLAALVAPVADPGCAAQVTTKPFAPWNDHADYVPVPNSGFEQGLDQWIPSGRVSLRADNNPFFISGSATDATSTVLAPGASIASASFCGGLAYPTIRMMSRSADGKPASAAVTVRYTGRDGLIGALPLGTITASSDWKPTEITLTASGVPLLTGTKLGVTITAVKGSIAVDDVYVDPFRRQ